MLHLALNAEEVSEISEGKRMENQPVSSSQALQYYQYWIM
jgi:hypothetical protein